MTTESNVSPYFDVRGKSDCTFQLYVIARGTGKTYTGLQECLDPKYDKFMFMRLTDKEISAVCSAGNPFDKLNADMGWEIVSDYKKADGFGKFYDGDKIIGYSAALSTFAGIRGLSFDNVEIIFFDELIPERHKRSVIKEPGFAFANMYETINRNRELEGRKPVKVIMACNAIDLDNDILHKIGAIQHIEEMLDSGSLEFTDTERDLYINISPNVPISKAKKRTAIYRLMGQDSEFTDMAINNKFVNDPLFLIKPKVPLVEYLPWVQVDDIYLYSHKSTGHIYVSKTHKSSCPIKIKKRQTRYLRDIIGFRYETGLAMYTIRYDSYETKIDLEQWLYR